MGQIKAIETHYKGCRFRSRLEARWAVFFDALGIKWEYELQGFEIARPYDCMDSEEKEPWRYLPDFFLPESKTWVEVKGSMDDVSDDYLQMIAQAIDFGGQIPHVDESHRSTRGLLWLGPIPDVSKCNTRTPSHPIIQHSKGAHLSLCDFLGDPVRFHETYDSCDAYACPEDQMRPFLVKFVYGEPFYLLPDDESNNYWARERLYAAYRAARSARFEHGESGAPR